MNIKSNKSASQITNDKEKTLKNGLSSAVDIRCNDFDDILRVIGGAGRYQKLLLWGFIAPFTAIMPLFIYNTIFMMYEPNHWCHVPGKPENISMQQWKDINIPMISSSEHSTCEMYATIDYDYNNNLNNNTTDRKIINCNTDWGWDYIRDDYTETMVTQFQWVCDKKSYATQAFTLFGLGKGIGTVIFGYAGDKFGRKRLFFLSILMNLIPRIISLYIANNFILLLILQFLVGTSFPSMYILSFSSIAEICDKDYRSRIYSLSWMIWVLGLGGLPLIAYLLKDWYWIGIMTSFPGFLLLFYWNLLPESPRLLLSQGKIDEAVYYLYKIAIINQTSNIIGKDQLKLMLIQVDKKKNGENGQIISSKLNNSASTGFWTLFSRLQLAKYTIYICITWSASIIIYNGLAFNTTKMAGNHFLNFFILALIEFPAGLVGWLGLMDKTGRRWTQAVLLILCAFTFAVAGFAVIEPNLSYLVTGLVIIAKFSVSLTTLIINLQTNEIFPTPLRATGSGFASTITELISICSPAIVYLDKFNVSYPYIVFTLVSVVGTITSLLLPETVGTKLPETIDESCKLHENTKFWKLLPIDAIGYEDMKKKGLELKEDNASVEETSQV